MPSLAELTRFIADSQPEADSPATTALLAALNRQYGRALVAVLFYGSCLRRRNHFDGLLDLYLIVDDYPATGQSRLAILGNRLLPPNVFYLEVPVADRTVRCKYALLALTAFTRGCQGWFHPYLWGRFIQPTAILFCRNETLQETLNRARAAAVLRFVEATLPCLPEAFSSRKLWSTGLDLSYASELRPEKPGQGERLYLANREYYDRLAELALPASRFPVEPVPGPEPLCFRARIPSGYRERARRAWKLRAIQGKFLSLLRLAKAAFTFRGGSDYICWKIERHSQVSLAPPGGGRHTPASFARVLWRAWRQGAFR